MNGTLDSLKGLVSALDDARLNPNTGTRILRPTDLNR